MNDETTADEALDRMLRASNPVSASTLAAVDLGPSTAALLEEIMRPTPANAPTPDASRRQAAAAAKAPADRTKRPHRGRRWALVAGVAAVVAAGATAYLPGPDGRGAARVYAGEVVAVAGDNDRLLVTADGWRVSEVPQLDADAGEVRFANGSKSVSIHWRAAAQYDHFYADRSAGADAVEVHLAGRRATMFAGEGSYRSVFGLLSDRHFIEVRGNLGSEQAFLDVLRSIEPVDVVTWLDALPAEVVKPLDRPQVVADLLAGVPVPEGFDAAALGDRESAAAYETVAVEVTGSVVCAWLDRYDSGPAGEAEAATALAEVATWPAASSLGPWGTNVQAIADAVVSGTLVARDAQEFCRQ